MRIQVLTLRYSAARGGFDDDPLRAFVRSHLVLSINEHFFYVDDVPHLACVVRWQEDADAQAPSDAGVPLAIQDPAGEPDPAPVARSPRTRRVRPDPTADLDEEQRDRFERLRAWRLARARLEGLPAYSLLTDRQLVAVVRACPESVEALASLEGVGAGKARLFGEALLAELASSPST